MSWRDKISPKRAWREAIFVTTFFYTIGTSLTVFSVQRIFFPWDRSDFTLYKGQLKLQPRFRSVKSKRLEFIFKADPDFIFTLGGDNYNALESSNEIFNLKTGDSVSVLIDPNEYAAKIEGKPASFWQRIFHWKRIQVFEVNHKDQNLLSLNKVTQKLKSFGVGYLIFGLILLIVPLFYLKREFRIYRRKKTEVREQTNQNRFRPGKLGDF